MINPKNTDNFYMQNAELPEDSFDFDSFNSPSDELDGIDVLVQTVKQHKLDPWNIDISDIADKYMLHLAERKSDTLRLSSRALLFLAILLKMKSNVLVGIDPMQFRVDDNQNQFEDEGQEFFDDDQAAVPDYWGDNVIPISDIIQRRTSVKQNRKRVVTLKDLIKQLEFYEQLDKKERIQKTLDNAKRRVTNFKNLSSTDIINLAQEDYIEPGVKVLRENLVQIFEKEEKVELNTLTLLGLDKTTAYVALLFLSKESDYCLEQEEFYSDLYVVKGEPAQTEELAEVNG